MIPKPDTVKKAIAEIRKGSANYAYFFDNLTSPDWIEPLHAEGFFKSPLEPKREDDLISFPFWPESRYLARMAAKAPERVLKVILEIPLTVNERVHEDLATAACNMPAELAMRWAKKEARWIDKQHHLYLLLPDKLAELTSHLARGGEVDVAIRLARTLLDILPDPLEEEQDEYESPEPRARFDEWQYKKILEDHIPDLVDTAGLKALKFLSHLLKAAVKLSLRPDMRKDPEDKSFIWRRAIEDHEQNRRTDLKNSLVDSVRDTATRLIDRTPSAVLQTIEEHPYLVFKRIGLHLRRRNPDMEPDKTASLIVDPDVFSNLCLHHEYYLLLEERFHVLPVATQKAYFQLVLQGPDVDESCNPEDQQPPTPSTNNEQDQCRLHRWQFDKLWPIRHHLTPQWQQRFEELRQAVGPIEHPEFLAYFKIGRFGPTSPKSVAELEAMQIDGLVEYLKTWRASGDWMGPTPEDLGRELKVLIASNPSSYASHTKEFQQLDPTYVKAMLMGFHEALKAKLPFEWAPVLDLCEWVTNQACDIPGRGGGHLDFDPRWCWSHMAATELISTGLEDRVGQISFELREMVWKALEPLTQDPNPTPKEENRQCFENMHPDTLSINTTRGKAMHAVVQYALWVRRHIETMNDSADRLTRAFDEMPEVRRILDWHLDPNNDPSLAIRSIYGQWFPCLKLLDRHWTNSVVGKVFPQDPELSKLRDAAWETYVTFCSAYDDVFELLSKEYDRAVDRINIPSSFREGLADPAASLTEHIMALYWHGKLKLDSADGLIQSFYDKAPKRLLAHALAFVGRSLHGTTKKFSVDTIDRLQILWNARVESNREQPVNDSREELLPFGWWFASGHFSNDWALAELKGMLSLTGKVEPDHLAVERLAILCSEHPTESVKCLRLMVDGDREGWKVLGWREHAKTILQTAIKSDNPQAKQDAITLVHRLGALGHSEYRNLA